MTKNRLIILALCLAPLAANAQIRHISLEECLENSHYANPDVLNASLDVSSAAAQKKEAFTNWFPTISATAADFHALNPLVIIGLEDVLGSTDAANNIRYYTETAAGLSGLNTEWPLLQHGYIAALTVTQPVFAGGRIANGNTLASLGIKAAGVKKDMALRDNDASIEQKYWTVVTLAAKKLALQQGMDLVRSLDKDVSAAYEAGLAKESDLLQVRLKAKELEATMTKLRSGERLAKMDLFNASGVDYSVLELDAVELSDGFDELMPPQYYYKDEAEVAAALGESKLLEMNVESKRLEKRMTLGEGLPEVALGASMGYGQVIGDPQANGMLYAVLKVPISDWGKTARKLQRNRNEIEKAVNDKEYLDKQLLLKVRKDWIEVQCAWDGLQSSKDALRLSELLESQKRDEYKAGLCTMSELLQAQTDLESSRSAYVDSQAAYSCALSVWEGEL